MIASDFPLEIFPGVGLGDILFGANPHQVKQRLGDPSRQVDAQGMDMACFQWFYYDQDCDLSFF